MTRYIARPVAIDAIEWTGDMLDFPADWRELDMLTVDQAGALVVRTNRGPTTARIGDFIIRGRTGELYPIDPATFHDKYQAVQA